MKKRFILLATLILFSPFVSSSYCQGAVRVASKKSIDQVVLGKALVLYLRSHSISAIDMTAYGDGAELRDALLRGKIDIYFESLSTGWFHYFGGRNMENNADFLYQELKKWDNTRKISWLPYAPANRTFAIVIQKEKARELNMYTISDLFRYMGKHRGKIQLLLPKELKPAHKLLVGLTRHYKKKMRIKRNLLSKTITVSHLLIPNVVGSGGWYVGLSFSTLGAIISDNLICLDDNLHYFPAYNISPVARDETLARHPRISFLINLFTRKVTTETLRKFDYWVSNKGKSPVDTAAEWLNSNNIVGPRGLENR